jgi:hypothetical protein
MPQASFKHKNVNSDISYDYIFNDLLIVIKVNAPATLAQFGELSERRRSHLSQ